MSQPFETDAVVDPERVRDLVVSYCFPPFADTASIVAAKRVRQTGRPVDVIQNAMDALRPRDVRLGEIAGSLVRRQVMVPTLTRFSSWASIRDFTEEGLQHALAWDRNRGGYEHLYSRAQFAASHFLAARFVLDRPSVSWTAEFSDPLSHDVTGAVRFAPVVSDALLSRLREGLRARGVTPPDSGNVYEWSELLAFGLADRVMFTNDHQRTFMLNALQDDDLAQSVEMRSVVMPHPTPDPEFYEFASPELDLDPARRNIAYFGNFYVTRGMGTVLDALAALPAAIRSVLALHVFANRTGELEKAVATRGLEDTVRVTPFVEYLDFLALTRRFDCLLVNDATTPAALGLNPFLPSKWSDYHGSGTAVWGMVEAGSALSTQPLDYCSPVEHTSGAVQVLARIAASNRARATAS